MSICFIRGLACALPLRRLPALSAAAAALPSPARRTVAVNAMSQPQEASSSVDRSAAGAIDLLTLLTNLKTTKRTGWVRCNPSTKLRMIMQRRGSCCCRDMLYIRQLCEQRIRRRRSLGASIGWTATLALALFWLCGLDVQPLMGPIFSFLTERSF